MDYQKINAFTIDEWNKSSWKGGISISHETYIKAKNGEYDLFLTPTKPIPKEWISNIKNKKVLALAAGGAQQCPILCALNADVTLLDFSDSQLEKDREFSIKENYQINIVKSDMSNILPFNDEEFDFIINPVSNHYVEDVNFLFKECNRVLKKNGILICGLDNGLNYVIDDKEDKCEIKYKLPFNPLKDENLYNLCLLNGWGIQFSHTIEDQIGGQLKNGFMLVDLFEDYNGYGTLDKLKVPTFIVTKSIKKED